MRMECQNEGLGPEGLCTPDGYINPKRLKVTYSAPKYQNEDLGLRLSIFRTAPGQSVSRPIRLMI